jgi:hypothetical protein
MKATSAPEVLRTAQSLAVAFIYPAAIKAVELIEQLTETPLAAVELLETVITLR